MANKDDAKATADQLRLIAKQVASGTMNPTRSSPWREPEGAEEFAWSFNALRGGIRDEEVSRSVNTRLNDLADKIEKGIFAAKQELQNHLAETATSNWDGVGGQHPTGEFTYTVTVKRK